MNKHIKTFEEYSNEWQGTSDKKLKEDYKNYKYSFMTEMRRPLFDAIEDTLRKIEERQRSVKNLYQGAGLQSNHLFQWWEEYVPELTTYFFQLKALIDTLDDDEFSAYFLNKNVPKEIENA